MTFSERASFADGLNALAIARKKLAASGRNYFDLSMSNPTQVGLTFPQDVLAEALKEGARHGYAPDPHGLELSRRAIAAHFADKGVTLSPERLFLCASTSEAYSYLFKLLCDPGDAVLVPQPGYPLFDNLAKLECVQAVGYELDYEHPLGWSIDFDRLRAKLASDSEGKIKAIVLINPNNPTGSYLDKTELEGIVALCKEYSLAIVADQVFFDFSIDPSAPPVNLYGFDQVLTFVLDGFSKRLCLPQVKLGWIYVSGPQEEVDSSSRRLEIIADAFLSAGTPIMASAGALLNCENEIQAATKTRMERVLQTYKQELEGPLSPHRVLRCEGGWTALVQSPAFDDEEVLAVRLLEEKGLYAHPGFFFDMRGGVFFALSLIIEPEDAQRAVKRYFEFFDSYCRNA